MKQIILVPMWLNMSPGKVASQCCHVVEMSFTSLAHIFGVKPKARIVVKVDTPGHMLNILSKALSNNSLLVHCFVDSDPTTENTAGQTTAVSITGNDEILQPITGHLELY